MLLSFDPNAAASEDSGIFGLPYSIEESKLVLIPVPWEVTTSYGKGTAFGPQCILQASKQVDLFDLKLGNFYEAGIAILPESKKVKEWNDLASKYALEDHCARVNDYSDQLNDYVYQETKKYLSQDKIVGLIGGDHSTPFGAIKAHLEKYPDMGILHFDAHADLREAFEGYTHSHASIMYNVITKTAVKKLVQVGIRDFCEQEYDFIHANQARINTFFDANLAEQKIEGLSFARIADSIISELPSQVYVSFDIDGLDPVNCPHTGTPVPGGLSFHEAVYLIKKVVQSGRQIVGFDLNEVSKGDTIDEWDANVGARLLYQLCGWTLATNK